MELGPSTIVGVGLALIGLIFYVVKTKKPDVSRDYDLFFSSVGLLCGGILIFQGWRLDPILLLCQILSSATAIFFIGESLWLRGNQSKERNLVPQSRVLAEKKKNILSSEFQRKNETFSKDITAILNRFSKLQKEPGYQEKKLSIRSKVEKEFSILVPEFLDYGTQLEYWDFKYPQYQQQKEYSLGEFDYTEPIDYCTRTFFKKE